MADLGPSAGLRPPRNPSHVVADVTRAALASTSTSLSVYLVAALAVELRSALNLSLSSFGIAVSCYYLAGAVGSIPAGRLTDRLGGARTMCGAALAGGAALLLISLLATSWMTLAGFMLIAGLANSAMPPSTNRFLIRRIPRARQGIAFGVKQASVPLAALLGGLAVPGIGLTIGWRWAFAAAACLAAASGILAATPRVRATPMPRPIASSKPPGGTRALWVLTVGFGLGIFAATGLTTFMVLAAVTSGIDQADAGLLLALAAATSIAARVAMGLVADRSHRSHFQLIALMLVVGAVGYSTLALGAATRSPAVFVGGAILAYGAGYGWNGLFNIAITHSYEDAPAWATGFTQTGSGLASLLGPTTFGLLVTHTDYAVGWLAAGISALLAAIVILLGRRVLNASTARRPLTAPTARSDDASNV